MKSNPRLLLIVMTISLVALFGWSVGGQETPNPKVVWEHAVVSSPAGDIPHGSASLVRRGGS
jgi:hypothetical protein